MSKPVKQATSAKGAPASMVKGGRAARASRAAAVERIIVDETDIREGMRALKRTCEVMRRLHEIAGDPPLRRHAPGFAGLARIIVGQQVSVASADAIWKRFESVAMPMSAGAVARLTDDDFRAAGLSRPKIKTMRAIAEAVGHGLDLEALAVIDETLAREQLLSISGIGPWTADIYLMFCAGRADVFAHGDLALQIAAQMAFELDRRPTSDELAAIAQRWSPWRGVAARMLWAYYRVARQSGSGAPL